MQREVKVLRGIPGCGKSTYTTSLHDPSRLVIVCSADHYFAKSGTYKFDPRLLGEAHDECFRRFQSAMRRYSPTAGRDTNPPEHVIVVVDNTNLTVRECRRYVEDGVSAGFEVEIVNIRCDPYIAIDRNVHGVPPDKVLQMHERMVQADLHIPTTWKQREVQR